MCSFREFKAVPLSADQDGSIEIRKLYELKQQEDRDGTTMRNAALYAKYHSSNYAYPKEFIDTYRGHNDEFGERIDVQRLHYEYAQQFKKRASVSTPSAVVNSPLIEQLNQMEQRPPKNKADSIKQAFMEAAHAPSQPKARGENEPMSLVAGDSYTKQQSDSYASEPFKALESQHESPQIANSAKVEAMSLADIIAKLGSPCIADNNDQKEQDNGEAMEFMPAMAKRNAPKAPDATDAPYVLEVADAPDIPEVLEDPKDSDAPDFPATPDAQEDIAAPDAHEATKASKAHETPKASKDSGVYEDSKVSCDADEPSRLIADIAAKLDGSRWLNDGNVNQKATKPFTVSSALSAASSAFDSSSSSSYEGTHAVELTAKPLQFPSESKTMPKTDHSPMSISGRDLVISESDYLDGLEDSANYNSAKQDYVDQLMKNVDLVFDQGGVLSARLDGYAPRSGQIEFSRTVAQALAERQILLVEAGTGTGKTFSYLVPPLLAGKTVMVSTGTKALQDQLISKDIPNLIDILDLYSLEYIALKGQSNYICRYLLEGNGSNYLPKPLYRALANDVDEVVISLDKKNSESSYGEVRHRMLDSYRPHVSCDSFLCKEMSSSCPYFRERCEYVAKETARLSRIQETLDEHNVQLEPPFTKSKIASIPFIIYDDRDPEPVNGNHCFVFASRQLAKNRDIVAINHSLFFASMLSTNEMGAPGSVLPLPDVLIFDEAHTLPDVGRNFLSVEFTNGMLADLPTKIHKAFEDTSVFTNSGDFLHDIMYYAGVLEVLNVAMQLLEPERYNILDFKYLHQSDCSVFQVLGGELVDGKLFERFPDSYVVQAARKLGCSWLNDHEDNQLGVDESDLQEKDAQEIDSERAIVEMKLLASQREDSAERLYKLFEERTGTKPKPSKAYGDDVETDYIFDAQDRPVQDMMFRAIMLDLFCATKRLRERVAANKNVVAEESKVNLVIEQCDALMEFIGNLMTTDRDKRGNVHWKSAGWVDVTQNGYKITVAPIDIGERFAEKLKELQDRGTTIIFTSATITVERSFDKFLAEIGLTNDDVLTKIVDSPFDYHKNACLFTSSSFPSANQNRRLAECIRSIEPILQQAPGGVFFLTTSYSAMDEAAEILKEKFGHQRKILVQGDNNVPALMKEFKQDGHGILVGTSSFWEGVDVPGQALCLVVIDKLPFKSIGDPMISARMSRCKMLGKNSFYQISLPEAIIMLRQGVGRLIRNESDMGVLVLLDPRLKTARYADSVDKSLPPMRRVSSLNEVLDFYNMM